MYARKTHVVELKDFVKACRSVGCDMGMAPVAFSVQFANGKIVIRWSDNVEHDEQDLCGSGTGDQPVDDAGLDADDDSPGQSELFSDAQTGG